jgi:uridine kinase
MNAPQPRDPPGFSQGEEVKDSSVVRYTDIAAAIRSRPPRLGPVRLVAVDGPAGSGKTTFADRLTGALRDQGVTVTQLHTDDLLDGWRDMLSFWPRLEHQVLRPLRSGEPGEYRAYDWVVERFEEHGRAVPVTDVLLVEGVSVGRQEMRPELTFLAWVEAPEQIRLARGLERDGVALRDEWLRWMAREAEHFARDPTAQQADLRIDGAPETPHDPRTEIVGVFSGWTGLTH